MDIFKQKHNVSYFLFRKIYLICIVALFASCSTDSNGGDIPPVDVPPVDTPKDEVSVLDFKKAGVNDREMIQKAIEYAAAKKIKVVTIPDGVYKIEPTNPAGILLLDNIHLKLSDNAVLKALPSSSTNYSIVRIHDAKNVLISGGKITGERDEHIGTKGEWGHGIEIRNSTDVELRNIYINDCWGDGIYIAAASKNVSMSKVICDRNRRQGMSVIAVDGLIVKDCEFKNTKGTAPMAGIDLEPNNNSQLVTNVLIENCSFSNNELGLHMYGFFGPVNNIKVVDCIMDKNIYGVNLRYEGVTDIDLSSLEITNTAMEGIQIWDGANDIKISKVKILNSTMRAIRIANATNIKLSDITINEYTTVGVTIDKSTDVTMSSSTLQTTSSAPNGFNLTGSESVILSKLDVKGGATGVYSSNSKTIELSESILKQQSNGLTLNNKTTLAKVHGNSFNEITEIPVTVNNSDNNKIYNNTFNKNCTYKDDTFSQIYFQGTSQGNEFNNNNIPESTLPNKSKYGVLLASTTQLNKIVNNTIDAASYRQAAIKDEGVNNQTN